METGLRNGDDSSGDSGVEIRDVDHEGFDVSVTWVRDV